MYTLTNFRNALLSSTFNRIDEECDEINKLVLSAKTGRWADVWQILGSVERPKKTYLINCIPEGRRWGVLHQAVYWRNPDILKRLLMYRGCDSSIKAKECMSECGQTGGKTALDIARAYGYDTMVNILDKHSNIEVVAKSTFAPYNTAIEHRGIGILAITLAAFKNTFHPEPVDKTFSVTTLLRDVFWNMNTLPTLWQGIKDCVCDTLFVVNSTSSKYIKEQSKNRESFYKAVINAYTKESTYLYDHVNTALRKQTETEYHPTANDLVMGPYIAMYKMLLLFWDGLPKESSTTYRKMLLSKEHAEKYQPGQKFTWLGFVSSSVDLQKAIPFPTCEAEGEFNVVFTIDNSTQNIWQPRDIEKFAEYHERERVYPAGARFQVTGRTKKLDMTQVQLKLIK